MKKKVILFDLDGTLLPMEQKLFVKAYFGTLMKKFAPLGYAPDKLQEGLWTGIRAMVKNTTTRRNEEIFWEVFATFFGVQTQEQKERFEEFYKNEFQEVRFSCGFNSQAAVAIKILKERGYRVVLATNPIFPFAATANRIHWAGIDPHDFEWITTYENSTRCKPNPEYYLEILEKIKVQPEECVMVGNDVTEDMIAKTLGIDVFLLPECLLNKENKDYSLYPQGGFDEMLAYIDSFAQE